MSVIFSQPLLENRAEHLFIFIVSSFSDALSQQVYDGLFLMFARCVHNCRCPARSGIYKCRRHHFRFMARLLFVVFCRKVWQYLKFQSNCVIKIKRLKTLLLYTGLCSCQRVGLSDTYSSKFLAFGVSGRTWHPQRLHLCCSPNTSVFSCFIM